MRQLQEEERLCLPLMFCHKIAKPNILMSIWAEVFTSFNQNVARKSIQNCWIKTQAHTLNCINFCILREKTVKAFVKLTRKKGIVWNKIHAIVAQNQDKQNSHLTYFNYRCNITTFMQRSSLHAFWSKVTPHKKPAEIYLFKLQNKIYCRTSFLFMV